MLSKHHQIIQGSQSLLRFAEVAKRHWKVSRAMSMSANQYGISHRVRIPNRELSFIHIIQTQAEKSYSSINKAVKKGRAQQDGGTSLVHGCREYRGLKTQVLEFLIALGDKQNTKTYKLSNIRDIGKYWYMTYKYCYTLTQQR